MANNYKKFVATAATATLVASAIVPVASAAPSDIAGNQFENEITKAIEAGLFQDSASFNPSGTLTRGHVVLILGRYLKSQGFTAAEDFATKPAFADLKTSSNVEYLEMASIVKTTGVFSGVAGNIDWNSPIKRQNMAAVLDRLAKTVTGTSLVEQAAAIEDKQLNDLAAVQTQFKAQVQALRDLEISTVSTFNPKGDVKRGQFAKFIMNTIKKMDTTVAPLPVYENPITKELAAVDTAVAALPKAAAVTAENAAEATKAVEAVTAAVTAATTAKAAATTISEEDAKAADEKLATATEAAKAVTAAVEATKMIGEISKVTALTANSVEVTYTKDSKVTEAVLKGQVLKVTDAAGKTFTATYSEKSLDKNNKATFTLAPADKLVDTVTYTVTSEISKGASFVAKVGAAKIADFTKVTTVVPAITSTINTTGVAIEIGGLNQYGEEIALSTAAVTTTATLNGMPLSSTEFKGSNGSYTVKPAALNEGDEIVVTLVAKETVNGVEKELAKKSLTYTVVKAAAPVASKIALSTTEDKTTVASGKELVVTAKVANQFDTPVADANVRWVVNGETKATSGYTYKFNETKSGTYVVKAFLADNTKVVAEKTIVVGAADLTALTYTTTKLPENTAKAELTAANKLFNNEELVLATISANPGAELAVSDLKFEVTKTAEGLKAEDIKVTAEQLETKTGEKFIVVKATTTKAGAFEVTPYVGTSFKDEKAVKSSVIKVNTSVNTEVKAMSEISYDASELKVGQSVFKEISFTNKHGEDVTKEVVEAKAYSITSSNSTDVAAKIVTGKKSLGQDEKKYYVETSATKEATSVITIQIGEVVQADTVKFVAAKVNSIVLADAKVTNVVAGDYEKNTKYNKLDVLDQDGKAIAGTNPEITVTKADGSKLTTANLVSIVKMEEVKGKLVETKDATQQYVKVLPTQTVAQGTYTVTLTLKEGEKEITSSFQVVVGEARTVTTLTSSVETSTITTGSTTTLTVVPKDQYGEVIKTTNLTVVNKGDEYASVGAFTAIDKDGKAVTKDEDIVAYTATVSAKKIGQSTIKVEVPGETDKPALATVTQNVTISSLDEAVKTVEIVESKLVDSTQNNGEVTLKAVGKDATGNDVALDAADLTWSVKSVKDEKGETLKINADKTLSNAKDQFLLTDGTYGDATAKNKVVVEVVGNVLKGAKNLSVEVEVAVETLNKKVDTAVIKFNGEGSKYVSGLAVFNATFVGLPADEATVAAKDLTDKGLKLEFSKDQVKAGTNTTIELTFTGVDQFGNKLETKTAGIVEVTATTGNKATVTVANKTESTIQLTAIAEGKATIYVTVNGETLPIEVVVPAGLVK